MSNGMSAVIDRKRAKQKARDDVLRMVAAWLNKNGYSKAGANHYTQLANGFVRHIGFQKLSGGGTLRVTCHVSDLANNSDSRVIGPMNDVYGTPSSPNGIKYLFGCPTDEEGIARSAEEYLKYLVDVVIPWLAQNGPTE
jgi:hypothetical protein